MKKKKRITEAVRAANRANSKKSTGPRTHRGKKKSQTNAVRHGLLSKNLFLKTDEEKLEFSDLILAFLNEFHADGFVEEVLVEEIATCFWKMQIALGLESRELASRKNLRDRLSGVFDGEIKLPLDLDDLPLDRGWDCERLVVRATAGQDVGNSGSSRGPAVVDGQRVPDYESAKQNKSQAASHVEFEAVLGNTLSNLTRYQSALKRDWYRAIETLRAVQKEKREQDGE